MKWLATDKMTLLVRFFSVGEVMFSIKVLFYG